MDVSLSDDIRQAGRDAFIVSWNAGRPAGVGQHNMSKRALQAIDAAVQAAIEVLVNSALHDTLQVEVAEAKTRPYPIPGRPPEEV